MNGSNRFKNILQYLFKNRNRQKGLRAAFLPVSVLVVFITTYALILPVITLDRDAAKDLPGLYTEEAGKASGDLNEANTENKSGSEKDGSSENDESLKKNDSPKGDKPVSGDKEDKGSQTPDTSGDKESRQSRNQTEGSDNKLSSETEILWESGNTLIRLRCKDGKKFPAGAKLKARLVSRRSDSFEFEDCLDAAEGLIRREIGENTSVSFMLYEIRIISKDGKALPAVNAAAEIIYTDPIILETGREARGTVCTLRDGVWNARFAGNAVTDYGMIYSDDHALEGLTADIGKVGGSDDPLYVGPALFKKAKTDKDKTEDSKDPEEGRAEDPEAENTDIKDNGREDSGSKDTGTDNTGTKDKNTDNAGTKDTGAEDKSAEDKGADNTGAGNKGGQGDQGSPDNKGGRSDRPDSERTETYEGKDFSVDVNVAKETGIPEDADLAVREIKKTSPLYDKYVSKTESALGWEAGSASYARVFDIKIVDADDSNVKCQPKKGTKVDVKIELADAEKENELNVVHFADGSKKGDVVDNSTDSRKDGSVVEFAADGFSVYVIVGTTIEKTVLASDGHNYRITATYGPESGIPGDAELEVNEITSDIPLYYQYEAQAENALGMEPRASAYVRLFDIKIIDKYDSEIKYQPADGTSVDVRIELADAAEKNELSVVHFAEGENSGSRVESRTEKGEDGTTVVFTADGFSVYAVVDGSTDQNARMTLEFYSNGTKIATMYVKNGDTLTELESILYDPGVGTTLGSGEVFGGWILDKENYTTADLSDTRTIEQVREWAAEHEITEGETHRLDATICKLYHITYKDLEEYGGNVLGMDSVLVKSTEYGTEAGAVTAPVKMAYTPKDDVHKFEGWELDTGSDGNVTSAIPSDRIYQNDDSITIKGDISFTVNAPEGNWLIFDENGKGGTYNAPQFVKSGENTIEPTTPMTRNGYTFGGWYDTKEHADAHGENPSVTEGRFTFGGELTEKTTLHASWIPNTKAPYTVILWGQKLNNTGTDVIDEYDVIGSYVNNNGVVGQNIPYTFVDNGDEDYVTGVGTGNGHYTGFCLTPASKNQQITITPEGDAVLNLYYDRIQYHYKFYLYRNGTQNNRYDYANNSGSGSGLNELVTWHSNQTEHPGVTGKTIQSETVSGKTYYYFVMDAYYGESISDKWPKYDQITGANNRNAVSFVMMVGTKLKPNATSSGSGTVKGVITVMDENILGATNNANGNYVVIRFPDSYYNWRYHIWLETVEGEDYTGKRTHTHNGKTYYEETVQVVRSSNTTDSNQNEPTYQGFDYVTRMGQNNSGTTWQGEHWTTNEGGTTLYHLNYIYNRQTYPISYFDGNYVDGSGNQLDNWAGRLLHKSEKIPQGARIADEYKNYVPDPVDGYVFAGWYTDEACTTPYPWGIMPIGGIKVYAKWVQTQYRVFLHPNAGRDENLDWGSSTVSTSFRVSYGGQVSTPTGTRKGSGYEFVGWYTDPNFSTGSLYTSDTVLNDTTVTTPYDKTEDTERDKWGNPTESGNKDADRFWITRKLDLYARWRKILEGAEGIRVTYNVDDGNGHVGTNPPVDESLYPDQADAIAQAADTAPVGMHFKCWVIQTWDEEQDKFVDTELTVLPGEKFTISEALAHKVEDSEEPGKYNYTMQLRAEYASPESELPTHIWWFKNYSDTVTDRHNSSHQDEGISVNEAVDIQSAPAREGYTFLGWARVPSDTSESAPGTDSNPPTGNVLNSLGADDLYLKYENGKFKLNDSTSEYNGQVVIKVAADERLQYHDMYAVWKKKTHKVTIRKVVQGEKTSDEFTIKYVFYDTGLTDGSVKLAHNQSQELAAVVPYGTIITVSETAEGYDKTYNAERTTDSDGNALTTPETVEPEAVNSGAFKITGDTTITVTNSKGSKKVRIYKIDDSTSPVPLNGVEFTLNGQTLTTGADLNDNSQMDDNENGYTGTITLNTSETPYQLIETTPKEHYTGLSAAVPVTVSDGGITVPVAGQDGYNENVSVSGPDANGVYTITVVNPRERYKVTVIKNVTGIAEDMTAEYSFTPTGFNEGNTITLRGSDNPETSGTVENQWVTPETGKIPYGTVISLIETGAIDFNTSMIVSQNETGTSVPEDNTAENDDTAVFGDDVKETGNITVSGDVTITYTNTRKVVDITLNKVAKGTTMPLLPGAEFKLYRKNREGAYATDGSIDAAKEETTLALADGKLTITGLPSGDYKLTETHPPEGYIIEHNDIFFTVNTSGTGDVIAATTGQEAFTSIGVSTKKTTNENDTLVIPNTPGAALPSTGGPGTNLIYLLGIMLTGIAGAGLVMRKRRRI